MRTKKLISAGIFVGSMLAASATVTALSITGTLNYIPFGSGSFDSLGLNGAQVTLDVGLGATQDDDDVGNRANSTLFNVDEERRDLSISGGSAADGSYDEFAAQQWSGLARLANTDRLSIGGSLYALRSQGLMLQLAGVNLDFDPDTFLGPDALGELGLPNRLGGQPLTRVSNAAPTNSDLVIRDEDGNIEARYDLSDPVVNTGSNAQGGSPETGGEGEGERGQGDPDLSNSAKGDPAQTGPDQYSPNANPPILAVLAPSLAVRTQGGDTVPGDEGSAPGAGVPATRIAAAAAVPAAPPVLLLLAGLAGLLARRRYR